MKRRINRKSAGYKWTATILAVVAFGLVVSASVELYTRQDRKDDAFFAAMLRKDEAGAVAALQAGANPNLRFNLDPDFEEYNLPEAPFARLLAGMQGKARRSHGQMTPLMHAAMQGHAGLVGALLARGADPNATLGGNKTALTFAVWTEHEEIARRLIRAGSDPEFTDKAGTSILKYASDAGMKKLVEDFNALRTRARRRH